MEKVMAIIEFRGKILIGKLKIEKIKDFGGIEYVFPGGSVNENEPLDKAVIREAKEETGLDIDVIKLIGKRIHPTTGKKVYYYYCSSNSEKTDPSSPDNDDIEILVWVSKTELSKYMPTLFPAVKNLFTNHFKNLRCTLSEEGDRRGNYSRGCREADYTARKS